MSRGGTPQFSFHLISKNVLVITSQTRRYLWGIQRLVSTHSNSNPGGGGVIWATKNSKSQVLANFSLGGGDSWLLKKKLKMPSSGPFFHFPWRGVGVIRGYSKLKVPSPEQIFIGGGRYSRPAKNRVFLAKMSKKFAMPNSGNPCITCVETNQQTSTGSGRKVDHISRPC